MFFRREYDAQLRVIDAARQNSIKRGDENIYKVLHVFCQEQVRSKEGKVREHTYRQSLRREYRTRGR